MTLPQLTLAFPEPEEWRSIVGFPDYQISDLGRVRRITSRTCAKAGTILKTPLRNGYPCVDLCNEKGRRTFHIHTIVARAFLPEIPGKEVTNHINADRTDNRLVNLERCSQSENVLHAYRMGLRNCNGEGNGHAKLTWGAVEEIRRIASRPNRPSYAAIGKHFGVTDSTIRGIVSGKRWNSPASVIVSETA